MRIMGSRLLAIAILAGVVGALGWAANALITRVTTSWVEQDALQRAELVVSAANLSLAQYVSAGDIPALNRVLLDIADDDQVMAVSACGERGRALARTERYPATVSCDRARALAAVSGAEARRTHIDWVDGVPVSVIPLTTDSTTAGWLVVVHDMRLAELRTAEIKSIIFASFALFGVASLVFAFFNRRLLSQSWTKEIRLILGGFSTATEFRTVLNDVRSLAARAIADTDARVEERAWTPGRLKTLVHDALEGARIFILANREPLIHQRGSDGVVHPMRPASGLVSALEPIIRACSGTWVAHGSGSADREAVDKHDRLLVPPSDEAYILRRVWLTEEQEAGYYYGFSNEGLWPLCHIAHQRPTFRLDDFEAYREVNQRFVDALMSEVDATDPIILVQDYHFALAPRMIRERMPGATIVAFWHIPWPNSERFSICPWRTELLQGMLGASIVGFHTQQHCNNFIDTVDASIEARIDRERNAVFFHGEQTLVRPYPISVEWPQRWSQNAPEAAEARKIIRARYGLSERSLIGIGVDRLDYTKGIEERFLAVERLLESHPGLQGRFSFIQLSAPSRTRIPRYQELAESVFITSERINERFGRDGYRPIILVPEHHEHDDIALHYRASHVCYVSSVHDGMNLVAKEFVASRDDEQGVLVLSHFTGASRELTEALVVNPYDIESAADALARAVSMNASEQRDRMRAMRTQVRESNVFRWAGRVLNDAARERRRMQLAERLARVPELRVAL
jgi:trehalose 6-phosphate synthase